MGNSRWRLETTLNYIGERVEAIGQAEDVEVLVTDWGSRVPLREAVRLVPAAAAIVSFVTVPPSVARKLQQDSPFPEVLALNAAARRARGTYIGRIDQDTLVGERFLRWVFESGLTRPALQEKALFFANRRSIPYRLTSGSPSLRQVTRFVRLFGAMLPVWRENASTGNVFWTSYVGIWLVHRDLWHECGGYDERLIYYNEMETDMICRLRQKYRIVDLGELTSHDFYHLEHYHPRRSWFARSHAIKNAAVDPATPTNVLQPNTETWGLREHNLTAQPIVPGRSVAASDAFGRWWNEMASFTLLILRLAAGTVSDWIVVPWTVLCRRVRRVHQELAGQRVASWTPVLWKLWIGSALRRRVAARFHAGWLRMTLAEALSALGLLALARRLQLRIALAMNPDIRAREREERERFSSFRRDYGDAFGQRVNADAGGARTALVISSRCPTIEVELCIIKALQLAGFRPVVLLEDEQRALRPYYELAGVEDTRFWSEFLAPHHYGGAAASVVGQCESLEDLLGFMQGGVRVGRIAACTALRELRTGSLNPRAPQERELLARRVASSMSSAADARRILQAVRPSLALFVSTEYTPKGELFDACLEDDVDVIAYDVAHKTNTLMFKRYGREARDRHLLSLSPQSWDHVRNMEWTETRRDRLDQEVTTGYVAGRWCGASGTHCTTRLVESTELRELLGLDPAKKTAVIFPHILWDAPFMWAKTLFPTYEEWLLATVRSACGNDGINWVIKIHPANIRKRLKEGYRDEPAETRSLREHVGTLPRHVVVIPPETEVSTFSLFEVMDYCLTVRGTVGIEAARLGIPVLTAAASRFSHLGFTVDSASREEYLTRVSKIQDTPALSASQRELAERFAYGMFVLRPIEGTSSDADEASNWVATTSGRPRARITIRASDEWRQAADVKALAAWFASRDEDFLNADA